MHKNLKESLRAEEDELNQQQEDSQGNYEGMKIVLEKKIQLYNKFISEDDLTELDRLTLSNRKEWQMSHLLGLIEHEDVTKKLSELTKRIYRLEKAIQVEEEES
jgi:hypothetical protein